MKKAKISELGAGLSRYLSFVRRGEPVLVYDRDRLIARIEPVRSSASSSPDWPADLERSGVLRAPAAALPRGWLRDRLEVRADVVAALLDERNRA
jgi:antitoxin (DNA-binding transcriptional repressor) of toxin-antitoxin stability system